VFKDPHALSIQDRYDNGEERWQTIGHVAQAVILLCRSHLQPRGGRRRRRSDHLGAESDPERAKTYEQIDR